MKTISRFTLSLVVACLSMATANANDANPQLADAPRFKKRPPVAAPPCDCRAPGGDRVALGGRICVHVDGETVTMRCEMSLNNPIWRREHQGCAPASS